MKHGMRDLVDNGCWRLDAVAGPFLHGSAVYDFFLMLYMLRRWNECQTLAQILDMVF